MCMNKTSNQECGREMCPGTILRWHIKTKQHTMLPYLHVKILKFFRIISIIWNSFKIVNLQSQVVNDTTYNPLSVGYTICKCQNHVFDWEYHTTYSQRVGIRNTNGQKFDLLILSKECSFSMFLILLALLWLFEKGIKVPFHKEGSRVFCKKFMIIKTFDSDLLLSLYTWITAISSTYKQCMPLLSEGKITVVLLDVNKIHNK